MSEGRKFPSDEGSLLVSPLFSPSVLETDSESEELVERTYSWTRLPTLQHGELLAEREILEEAPTRPREANLRFEAQDNESKHGQEL